MNRVARVAAVGLALLAATAGMADAQEKTANLPERQLERFRESRARLAGDPYRPLYHFSVPENVLNDPNGLCHWRGRYHVFYQFTPQGEKTLHWGHAVSPDLIRWEDLPVALSPLTEQHVFSGQTLVERDRVIAIYHGVGSGNSIATASDEMLLNWVRHPGNPVIPLVKTDATGHPYRVFDPAIWKEDDGYYSLSGSYWGAENRGGPVSEKDGAVPNFLPISRGKHMLLFFGHKRAAQYYIGDYDRARHRFLPDVHGRMNYGPVGIGSLHAPSAKIDAQGRYLAAFNMKEGRWQSDWSGVMTLPREFTLEAPNALGIKPVGEVERLRFQPRRVEPMEIPANREIVLPGIRGRAMEIEAVIEPQTAREVGMNVFRSADGAEAARISFYRDAYFRYKDVHLLQIDVSASSLRNDVRARTPEAGPLRLLPDEPLRLRVFLDRSIVEVFANGRQCLSVRVYPDRADSTGVSLFARGGKARLARLEAWQMRSIWPELKFRERQ